MFCEIKSNPSMARAGVIWGENVTCHMTDSEGVRYTM